MNIGCRIIKDFERPPKELVRRFYDLAVSDLDDTMSKFGAVDHRIQPMRKYNRSMVGTAFTIRLPHGDNLMFRAAIQYIKRGDVVVIDAGGFEDRAVAGEVTAKYCRARGAKGLIIDGATRDSAVLSEMENFPVFVRAISPNGPYFNGRAKSMYRLSSADRLSAPVILLLPIPTVSCSSILPMPRKYWRSLSRLRPVTGRI